MTNKLLAVLATAGIACLGGCGTIVQGIHQDIAVSSTPPGASCDLAKKDSGESVGSIDRTPGSVHVRKTKHDLLMTCKLAGYQDASVFLKSGIATGVYGNAILGGVAGWGIDSATGADNEYPSTAQVTFVPVGGPTPGTPTVTQPTSSTGLPGTSN